MTPEQKVALLKEAGVWDVIGYPTCIDKLFELFAAREREKLIPKVAPDGRVSKTLFTIDDISKASEQGYQSALVELEAAVLAEREACANVCDEYAGKCVEAENWEAEDVSLHCAAAIRARSMPRGDK